MKEELLTEIDRTSKELLHIVLSFKQENFNTIPFEGSWTAAQVTDHLFQSIAGVLEMLYGQVVPGERTADEKRMALRKMFLDFRLKMKSPPDVLPATAPLEREKMLIALKSKMEELYQAAKTQDLSVICSGFDFPGFGPLSRLEWLYFFIYHTIRHTKQLKDILAETVKIRI